MSMVPYLKAQRAPFSVGPRVGRTDTPYEWPVVCAKGFPRVWLKTEVEAQQVAEQWNLDAVEFMMTERYV